MAGNWIIFEHATLDKPEVIAIAEALGMDEYAVVGRLCKLWVWADQQTDGCNAVSVTEKWLDRYIHAPGFAAAMAAVGWLTVTGTGIVFPKIGDHTGQTAKTRALTRTRVRAHRAKTRNAPSVTPALPQNRTEPKTPLYAPTDRTAGQTAILTGEAANVGGVSGVLGGMAERGAEAKPVEVLERVAKAAP